MYTAYNTMKKRNLAAILCIMLIFATMFSFFFIIEEANHHCSGRIALSVPVSIRLNGRSEVLTAVFSTRRFSCLSAHTSF